MTFTNTEIIIGIVVFILLLPFLMELNKRVYSKSDYWNDPYWGYKKLIDFVRKMFRK